MSTEVSSESTYHKGFVFDILEKKKEFEVFDGVLDLGTRTVVELFVREDEDSLFVDELVGFLDGAGVENALWLGYLPGTYSGCSGRSCCSSRRRARPGAPGVEAR